MSSDNPVPGSKASDNAKVDVVELHELSQDEARVSVVMDEKWQPGFWKQFPWLGFSCLVTAILVSIAAILVLVFSDGKAASQWDNRVAPNVILSILNSAASVCIAIAVANGVAVSWWRKAMQGATITELHNTWSFGASVSAIFLNIRYFNLAALAALVTKLTIIDGVLFQRAATTYVALGPAHPHNITTFPTTRLPSTGRLNSYGNDTDILLYAFTYDVQAFVNSAWGSIYQTYGFFDCEGICALNFSAPGYVASCETIESDIDLVGTAAAHAAPNATLSSNSTEIFGVDFSMNYNTAEKNYTWIGVNTTSYTRLDRDETNSSSYCPATLYRTQCELRQAMITYPVYLQLSNVSTKSRHEKVSRIDVYLGIFDEQNGTYLGLSYFDYTTGQLPGFEFQEWIEGWKVPGPLGTTASGGIYRVLENQYRSRAFVTTRSNDTFWTLSTEAQFAGLLENNEDEVSNNITCPYSFDDPMHQIMVGLNALTFITSDDLYNRANYTNGNFTTQEQEDEYWYDSLEYVLATQYKTEVHYQTKIGWMFGALASTLVCIMLILPVYWGFWELGRKVSLNPIEIANAFQAPVLANVHGRSGHADDVVKVAGGQRVAYTVAAEETGRRYKIVPR